MNSGFVNLVMRCSHQKSSCGDFLPNTSGFLFHGMILLNLHPKKPGMIGICGGGGIGSY